MNQIKFQFNDNKYEAYYDGESCDLYKNDKLHASGRLSDVMDSCIDEGLPKSKIAQIYKSLTL